MIPLPIREGYPHSVYLILFLAFTLATFPLFLLPFALDSRVTYDPHEV
jgi:hypothetical protein